MTAKCIMGYILLVSHVTFVRRYHTCLISDEEDINCTVAKTTPYHLIGQMCKTLFLAIIVFKYSIFMHNYNIFIDLIKLKLYCYKELIYMYTPARNLDIITS